MRSKLTRISNRKKILSMLTKQDPDPYMVERIYPYLARNAGKETTPQGLNFLIAHSIYDATRSMDPMYQKILNLQFERFIDALTTAETVRTIAKNFYRAARASQVATHQGRPKEVRS